MKSITRYIFILFCASFGPLLLLEIADYSGIYTSPLTRLLLLGLYSLACFSSYLWVPKYLLATMRIRKTIIEEEEWLHPLCHELNIRTGIHPTPEILVLEAPSPNAFAIGKRTIIVSRGLLVQLSEPEIKAMLAHEYGHLIHGDTITGGAFGMALFIPVKVCQALNFILCRPRKKVTAKSRNFFHQLIAVLIILWAVYQFPEMAILLLSLYVYWKLFPQLQILIIGVWCYFCRADEFRQDQFAQSLGCGLHLKSALLKMDDLNSGELVTGFQQLFSSHPMLYARIRRLEWLEGMRTTA